MVKLVQIVVAHKMIVLLRGNNHQAKKDHKVK